MYSIQKSRQQRSKKQDLEELLKREEKLLCVDPTEENYLAFQKTSSDLNNILLKEAEGRQIRARARWVEKGEKSTKYFFGLEKRNNVKKNIVKLKTEKGKVVTDLDGILKEEVNFYKNLYCEKPQSLSFDDFVSEVELPTLSQTHRNSCEGLISEEECYRVLRKMKKNKSPGYDGFTIEFYCVCWPLLGSLIVDSFNSAFNNGSLSISQQRGVITLLHKKNEPELLKNWRPVSLLCTDYKILTQVLSNRVSNVISNIVNPDQVGYIKGRFVGEIVRLIDDMYHYTARHNIPGAVLYVDFEKAFDCINWEFMHQSLERFGFGPEFRRWVKVIYSDVQSCIINNGWMSNFFSLTRGVRQGCPLSALLFVMCVEVLACKIRQCTEIEGIQLPCDNLHRNVVKIAQLADDTTLFLKDEKSIIKVLKFLEDFEKTSGLKMNKDKTEGVWLGKKRSCKKQIQGLKWTDQPVKALGVWFGYDRLKCEQLNWEPKVAKFENVLKSWGKRFNALG